MVKAILISATGSGRGKTSVTLGLLAALARRGLRAAPFKTGPDFIDPGLHALACGRQSHNLDSWMLDEPTNRAIFGRYAAGADLAVIEGAMGLYDGMSGTSEAGSAAHMARLLGAHVVLVLDASGMGRSVAAMAQGFAGFDPGLSLAGVVCNKVGSPAHADILRQALGQAGLPVLGMLARRQDVMLPSRHLGLVTAADLDRASELIDRLADWVEQGLDVEALLAAAPAAPVAAPPAHAATVRACPKPQGQVRLGVAFDRAFCFTYAENLRLMRQAGAELVFFSPLADRGLPPGLDGLYLPGGYPELHAATLATNTAMLADLRDFSQSGRPVYAECGGFMTLMESIEDASGQAHTMARVFPCRAVMGERFASLGYREAAFTARTPLGPAGTTARGHEFHYSRMTSPPGPGAYAMRGRAGAIDAPEGFVRGNTLGSYVHLHFGSNQALAVNFVAAMRAAGACS